MSIDSITLHSCAQAMDFFQKYIENYVEAEGLDYEQLQLGSKIIDDDFEDVDELEEKEAALRKALPWDFNARCGTHSAWLSQQMQQEDGKNPNRQFQILMAKQLRQFADVCSNYVYSLVSSPSLGHSYHYKCISSIIRGCP